MTTVLTMSAQNVILQDSLELNPDVHAIPVVTPQLRAPREATTEEKEYAQILAEEREAQQQIDQTLPKVDENGQVVTYTDHYYPYYLGGGWTPAWNLHKGLNVNISSSVFANLGGHGHHGAGFTQDISLMYVTNLSKKATLAVGGYFNNMTYHGTNYTTAGISAILGYQFNEHLNGYVFAQKAFNSDNMAFKNYGAYPYYGYYTPYGYWGMYGNYYGNGCAARNMDRIGGGLRYEWGEHNFIQIQFEIDRTPEQHYHPHYYNNQRYDYPAR